MIERERESGISPIIAEILMVALILLAAVIAYVSIFQLPSLEKIPMVAVDITKDGNLVTLYHKNGDSLEQGTFYVAVNGNRVPDGNVSLVGGAYPYSPGERLVVNSPGGNPVREVKLVYAVPSVSVVLASAFFPGPAGNTTPLIPTPTPTPTPTPHIPQNSITLNTDRQGDLVTGGYMQFRVTGLYSIITYSQNTYNLNQGDTVRITIGNDKKGSIYATSGSISDFSFNNVGLSINGVSTGSSGNLKSIWINGYDNYASTLTLDVPSHKAWTSLVVDGTPLINGDSSSHIQIINLKPTSSGGGMNLDTKAGSTYYIGEASSYSMT